MDAPSPHLHSVPGTDATPARAWRAVACVLVGVYLGTALPLIFLMGARGRPGEDQVNYHLPAVLKFARELPAPDLHDYLSATTPGYHLFLAGLARTISEDPRFLRASAAIFSVLLLVVLARTIARSCTGTALEVFALCAPVLASTYVFQAGVWLLPDNAGWLMVLVCLALALAEPFRGKHILLAGIALLGVVLVRQVHLWVAGPLWAAAWLAPGLAPPGGVGSLLTRFPARVKSLAPMVLASVPAFGVLAWFVRMWGGLTPPTFQGQYSSVSLAAFPFLLSLVGLGSVFFVGYLADPLADALRPRHRRVVLLAAAVGAVAAIVPNTTYSVPNRASGLWNLVKIVPTIAHHTSPVLVLGSALGAGALAVWWRALPPRVAWILFAALGAFGAAQAMSGQVWQRYNEPMVLLTLSLMASHARPIGMAPMLTARLLAPIRIGGVCMLACILLAISILTISRFGPAATYDIRLINQEPGTTTAP